MGKFKKRFVVIPILVLAIGGVFYSALEAKRSSASVVSVVKVSEADESYDMYGEESSYSGSLKKGSVQNVKVNTELKIDEVKVKKGDKISKGDVLFTYETKSLELNAEEAENNVKAVENKIKIAENELSVLKKLQPSENAPKDYVPEVIEQVETFDVPSVVKFEYEKRITPDSIPVMGNGSADEPFIFYVGSDTVVTKEYLISLCGDENGAKFALFYVCDEEGDPLFARLVDGSKIDAETIEMWCVSDGVEISPEGNVSYDGSSSEFAIFIMQSNSPIGNNDEEQIPDSMPQGFEGLENLYGYTENAAQEVSEKDSDYEISEKDNYVYSKEELKTMISEKEKEIEQLGFEKKQAEINVKKAKLLLETGAEVAELSGTVTFVAKDINHLSESGAYITITSSSGMSVASTIGEFSLSKISIGMPVTVTDWSSGSSYSGEITSISDKPQASDSENSTESYYEFVVTVEESFEINEDGYVSIQLDDGSSLSKGVYLYGLFVRQEGGRYYVMVANEDNVIEKRYVTVGNKMYGIMFEVVDGITRDDRIANAYGNTAEGMPVVDGDYDAILYGSSLLY